ncbi:MAG: hypothetical protein WCB02_24605 [Bradyrhizobium sp.]
MNYPVLMNTGKPQSTIRKHMPQPDSEGAGTAFREIVLKQSIAQAHA